MSLSPWSVQPPLWSPATSSLKPMLHALRRSMGKNVSRTPSGARNRRPAPRPGWSAGCSPPGGPGPNPFPPPAEAGQTAISPPPATTFCKSGSSVRSLTVAPSSLTNGGWATSGFSQQRSALLSPRVSSSLRRLTTRLLDMGFGLAERASAPQSAAPSAAVWGVRPSTSSLPPWRTHCCNAILSATAGKPFPRTTTATLYAAMSWAFSGTDHLDLRAQALQPAFLARLAGRGQQRQFAGQEFRVLDLPAAGVIEDVGKQPRGRRLAVELLHQRHLTAARIRPGRGTPR